MNPSVAMNEPRGHFYHVESEGTAALADRIKRRAPGSPAIPTPATDLLSQLVAALEKLVAENKRARDDRVAKLPTATATPGPRL